MADKAEASFAKAYRDARKAFIAASARVRRDSIARVHPSARGPDGKPLFIDSVALGARDAAKALLVLTGRDGKSGLLGSRILTGLLDNRTMLPTKTRLVLVHALNPFGFAWGRKENEDGLDLDDPAARTSWSFAMLSAIAAEDLAKARTLHVMDIGVGRREKRSGAEDCGPIRVLADFKPGLDLAVERVTLLPGDALPAARRAVNHALAAL